MESNNNDLNKEEGEEGNENISENNNKYLNETESNENGNRSEVNNDENN